MSPSKFVFMACVALQLCFHGVRRLQFSLVGVCHLLSLFSWRVSPYKFVFMARVAFNLALMACVAVLTSFWRVSPSKFLSSATVTLKFVSLPCVANQVCFSWRVSPFGILWWRVSPRIL